MTDAATVAEDSFTAEMRDEVLWVEWVAGGAEGLVDSWV
jgi:hypothetical protein